MVQEEARAHKRHHAAVRAEEIDRRLTTVDLYAPYKEAVSESERVERNYGQITEDYQMALHRAKERATGMQSLVKGIQTHVLTVLHREEQEDARVAAREVEALREEEEEIETTIKEDEDEMIALGQEEELYLLETRRVDAIHKATMSRLAQHKRAAQSEHQTAIDEVNRRAAEQLLDIDTDESKELDRVKKAFDEWKYEQDTEFARQRQIKIDAGDIRKKQKRMPLDDAQAVVGAKRKVFETHSAEARGVQVEIASLDGQLDLMRPDYRDAVAVAESARREATEEAEKHRRMIEEFLRDKEDRELQLAKMLQDEREEILFKRKGAQAELRRKLQAAQEKFKDKTDALHNMMERVDNRQLKRQQEEAAAASHITGMKDELSFRISNAPNLEHRITEIIAENEAMPGKLQRELEDFQAERERSFTERERTSKAEHASRLAVIREHRAVHEAEYHQRMQAERKVIDDRVEKVTKEFSPFLIKQSDARAAAMALAQSCGARIAHLMAEKSSTTSRHEKSLGTYESEWSKKRAREQRRVQELMKARTQAEAHLSNYQLESEHKLGALRAQLEGELTSLKEAEATIASTRLEDFETKKDTRLAEEAALRSRYASLKAELTAKKRELAALYEPLNLDKNLQPLEQASKALDNLEGEVRSKEDHVAEEEAACLAHETEADARIQAEQAEGQRQIRDIQVEAAERLSALRRDWERDRIALTGERDQLLRSIELKTEILRNKVQLLENAIVGIRNEAAEMARQAASQLEVSELSIRSLERSLRSELDEDISLDEATKRQRFDERAHHRLAAIGILTERVRHSDAALAAETLEVEATKLESEAEFLKEDLVVLDARANRLRDLYARRLAMKESEAQMAQAAVQDDADEMQAAIERIIDIKKLHLRAVVVDRKARLEVSKSRLRTFREESLRQSKCLDGLAEEVSYNVKRGEAKRGMKDLRKVEMELQSIVKEEERAVAELRAAWFEEDAKLQRELEERLQQIGQKKYLLVPRQAYLNRELELQQQQVAYLNAVVKKIVAEQNAESERAQHLEADRTGVVGREKERVDRTQGALSTLMTESAAAHSEAKAHLEHHEKLWNELETEYKTNLAIAQDQRGIHEIEKWNQTQEAMFAGQEAQSAALMNTELEAIKADQRALREELKERQIAIQAAILEGQQRLEAARQAVPDNAQRIEELHVLIEEAIAAEEKASERRHEEDTIDLKDLTGMKDEHAKEIGAVQLAAEAEFRLQEEAIDVEESDRMEKIAEKQRSLELHVAAESAMHKESKERVELLKGRAEELEEGVKDRDQKAKILQQQKEELLHRLGVIDVQLKLAEAELRHQEAVMAGVKEVVDAECELIDQEIRGEVDEIDARRRMILEARVKDVRAELDRIEAQYGARKEAVKAVHAKELAESERLRDDELAHLANDERDALRELERMKVAIERAATERADLRSKKREADTKARAEKIRLMRDKFERGRRRYNKDMVESLRVLEDQWALLLANLEDERRKLNEERDREITRLEVRAKAEIESERRRKEKEVQDEFERRQAEARAETERMREEVLAELRRMEEESRNRMMEEMRRLQMLQMMMQQEALTKLDATMQTRLKEIEGNKRRQQEDLERGFLQEQIRLREEMLLREQERLSKLASAWQSSKANTRRAVADGQIVMEGREKVEREIAELQAKEEELYKQEQRKIEEEMARVEAELAAMKAESGEAQ